EAMPAKGSRRAATGVPPEAPVPEAPAVATPGVILPARGDSVKEISSRAACAAPSERRAPCFPVEWVTGADDAPLGTGSPLRSKGSGPPPADASWTVTRPNVPAARTIVFHLLGEAMAGFNP